MAISNYLDISTGYVTKNDMDLLDLGDGPVISTYDQGAILYVPDEEEDRTSELAALGFSASFIAVLAYADKHGCYLVRLDADADDDIADYDNTLTKQEW